jgi:hypothetical protein
MERQGQLAFLIANRRNAIQGCFFTDRWRPRT